MAVALVIIVIIDTALTGYMVARQRHISQKVAYLEKVTAQSVEAIGTNARIINDMASKSE